MTDDEVKNLPATSALLAREEFVAWIASRKEAGAKIDIGTAELKGWWESEGDPYALSQWRPKEADWNNYEPPRGYSPCIRFAGTDSVLFRSRPTEPRLGLAR